MWSQIAAIAATVALAAACNKPAGDVAGYDCPEVDDGFDSLKNWDKQYGDWIGTPPAVMDTKNAWTMNGQLSVRIKQESAPSGQPHWVSDKFDNQCACGYKALTSGLVASKKEFGEGYYEARIRSNGRKSPFMSAFWLQGSKAEINVIEFVGAMRGDNDKSTYWTDFHCFDPADTSGESTRSNKTFFQPQGSFVPTTFHTYGVDWAGNDLTFYVDGKAIRTAKADCLVGESMTVLFSQETRPEFDGDANGENTLTKALNADMTMKVDYFRYYVKKAPAKDCAGMGWDNTYDNVCSSVNTGGVCGMATAVTRDAAEAACAAEGARLCTPLEAATSTGLLDKSGTSKTGCSKWAKWKQVWAEDADGKCTNGQVLTTNGNAVTKCVAPTATALTQCCLSEPVRKFCGNADSEAAKMYTPTANGVCARADWGTPSAKKCVRLSFDNAEVFCKERGGNLCTNAQLKAVHMSDPADGRTVDKTKLAPGGCAGAKIENTWTWVLNSDGTNNDLHCENKNTEKGKDFFRPLTKWQGFLRSNKKSGKVVKDLRCAYKGNRLNTQGQKAALCCFQE